MYNNKNFLVLGIGNAQVDLLHHMQLYEGIVVHALSNTEIGRGRSFIQKFEKVNITNKEEVLRYCQKNGIHYIYSVGSDVAMPTVTWVAEQLGLKTFISFEIAYICNNKHLLRERLKGTYGSVPFEILDESLAISQVSFPAIVKPVDSQGQRGITEVHAHTELKSAYKKAIAHSRKEKALIEEKIDGSEVSLHVYLKDGKLLFFLPSSRISWKGYEGGIIHKHILPASITKRAEKNLRQLALEVIENLGIKNGPVYFQIKMKGDEPYLIEVTPRLDGCHMWRQIYKSTGINLLDVTIRHIMDLPFEISEKFPLKPSVLEFLCQPPNLPFEKQEVSTNACYHEYYYREGDIVRPMNGQLEKCGYQILLEIDD